MHEVREAYSIEKRILLSLITNTSFCNIIIPLIDLEYFTNEYAQTIIKWVVRYYNTYGKAPNKDMEDIFYRSSKGIKQETSEVIASILEHLSELDTDSLDTEYSIDLAKEFFTARLLILTSETVLFEVEQGNIQKATDLMFSYKGIPDYNSGVGNTYTDTTLIMQAMEKIWYPQDSKDILFRLDGELGDFIGDLERGWLIGILAPMKRGKSWMLADTGLCAVRNRKTTLFISLEMPDKDMAVRNLKTITGMYPTESKEKIIPVFDCKLNQNGGCNRPNRVKGNTTIISEPIIDSEILKVYPKHIPCTVCKGTSLFSLSVWYKKVEDTSSFKKMQNRNNAWKPTLDQYMRTCSFPARSININTIIAYMDMLSKTEGFDTAVLILDYADLLLPTDLRLEYRHAIDNIWTSLKSLAHKRNILVITASQTNRAGMNQEDLTSDSAAEDIRKIAIADSFFGYNQSKLEKRKGIARIALLDGRHISSFKQCFITQDLVHGQVVLDSHISEYIPESNKKEEHKNKGYKKTNKY